MLALERAYRHAGYGVESVALFEGHGTGTPIGDEVELQTIMRARKAAYVKTPAAAIGSIKANIGHTKAAAGIAGLIKATMAVYQQALPPTTGVRKPHAELEADGASLRVLDEGELWPERLPLRAGINSFGFGGINVHVTIEGSHRERTDFSPRERALLSSAQSTQDAELFLLDADAAQQLAQKAGDLAGEAQKFSYSDLSDVATALAEQIHNRQWRAAVVARTPTELADRLSAVREMLEAGTLEGRTTNRLDPDQGVFVGAPVSLPRIAFLFPGQASPVRLTAGIHGRRFPEIREFYEAARLPVNENIDSTHVAQLAIVASELAGLRLLRAMGITASVSLGHSLGELVAYCWAGALDEASLLHLVDVRGRLMAQLPGPAGAMANIGSSPAAVGELIQGEPVVLACYNAPNQTVVAGQSDAISQVVSRAQASGWNATVLPAAHAFHSPLMSPAAQQFQEAVSASGLTALHRRVVSTITGDELPPTAKLDELLVQQLTVPVRFLPAMQWLEKESDLCIEVGPGRILTQLVAGFSDLPVVGLDPGGLSLLGVLQTAAAAFVKGVPLQVRALFGNRFTRPFKLGRPLRFFANPCESAPISTTTKPRSNQIYERRNGRPKIEHHKIEHSKIEHQETTSCTAAAGVSATHVVQALVAQRTELPPAAVQTSARLLGDLHLNSIVVAEIVAAAARELGMAPSPRPLDFADATVGELAQALERLNQTAPRFAPEHEAAPAGIGSWVRAFLVEWGPSSARQRSKPALSAGVWNFIAHVDQPLLNRLSTAEFPGSGVIVFLSSQRLEEQAGLLLQGAQAALRSGEGGRYFVVAGPQASVASAFVRTLHLENPDILTRVIEAPIDSDLPKYICQEIAGAPSHMEARYDVAGHRWQPGLRLLSQTPEARIPIASDEVILVTGGGKGIVAECASALAEETGARLLILGRSRPEDSPELAEHLDRLVARGVKAKYIPTDVSDAQALRATVRDAETDFGRIAGIVHGAGCNEPLLARDLDEVRLRRALAPKLEGLRNLIDAVDAEHLRLLVAFGSVIGRVGLRGESHYAFANAGLAALTEEFAGQYPACRCLVFESSAWSGVGMAERLGTIEALRREGIATITPKEGVAWFRRLVASKLPAASVVVTGRLGAVSPLPIQASPLPMLRFLERPRVHYPGVELVVECDLTTASDPYLLDHVFQHEPLLPGVIGLEAMAQVAMAVASEDRRPVMEDVRFERSVAVEPRSRVTVRIAALVREPGLVEVALRSSQTSFAIDNFRCICRFTDSQLQSACLTPLPEAHHLPIEPERDLYGSLMFQSGRFRRLAGYRSLGARFSMAEIAPAAPRNWFSQYLSETLVLGDPAARDAALHSIQACVPHAVLLPVAVERIMTGELNSGEKLFAQARERWQEGTAYCYDLELRSADGILRELWQGLTLRKVADAKIHAWPDPLVAASLEWRLREMAQVSGLVAAFERDSSSDRRSRSERAIQKAIGSRQRVRWRSDGRPEVDSKLSVSSAHMDGLTLGVAGPHLVTCDLEPVRQRPDHVWNDLLGLEGWNLAQFIASHTGEDLQTAATRVWTALESLKKAAKRQDGQMVLLPNAWQGQGCVALEMAGLKISSTLVRFRDNPLPVAVSILTGSEECVPTSTGTESALKKQIL
jgi:enediyne polyketide synthase